MTNDLGIDWDKAEEVDAEGNSLSHGIDWESAPEVDEGGNPIVTAKGDAPIPIASKETSEIKGKVGVGEFSQLSYERDTGADAPKNPILATIANMGATVGGKLNANLQMRAAQRLAAGEGDVDELMDEMIYGGVKKVADAFKTVPSVAMPGMIVAPQENSRQPNEVMADWDKTFGGKIADEGERAAARREYAKQIATDFIKERTAVKQNAETELSNREVSTMGAIVGEGLGMVGYSLPYMLGPAGIALQFAEESAANATGLMNDEYGYDENGNFRLVAKGDDAERAWAMGAASAGIETATEVALGRLGGAAIKRALKPVGKIGEAVIGKFPVVEKIGEKIAATKVGEASAKFAAGLKNILGYTRRKLKIGDFFEENLEEYESGFLNAMLGSEMRESELGDSTVWSRLKDFHKEFFKPEKLLEMNEAMVLTMGGGAFVAHCAQRKALKTVDDIIRRNELMTEEELGKADLRTKAMALEAWTDKMGEDEIVNRFKKANGIIENLADAIAGESGKEASEIVRLSKEFAARNAQYLGEELEKLNIPEQKFEIPRTVDGKVDFKKVYLLNMKTGETVLHNMAADTESGIFITDNGEKGESAFSVFSPDGKTSRDFASLNEAIEYATMMKNKLALDRAKDDLKRQYIRNEVERNYQGAPNQILDFKTIEEAVEASKELGVDVTASPNFKADKSGWRLKDGTVILVRDNITSPKSVSETLRHEIVGHSDAAMDVKFMEGAKRGVGQVGLNYEFGKLKMELAGRTDVEKIEETALREAVANYLMHRRHEARIGDKAVSAIRQMMREKLGFKLSVSDAELEARISKVEKEFRKGKGGNLNSADAQGGAWKIQGEVEENIEAPEETTEEVVEEKKNEEPKAESAEDSRAAYLNEVGEFAMDADKKFAQVATEEEIAKAREILKAKGADSEYSKLVNDVNAAADKAAEEASKAAGVETMERVSDLKSYIEAKPNLSEAERASLQGAVVKVANSDDMMGMGADEAIFNTLLRHGSLMLLKPNTVDKSDAHLPNFKLDVNPKTGIGKPLEGKWIPSMGGFGVVWMMKDGTLVQGTGRHRSNKADEANAPMWNVVLREADGWTKEKVSLLDGIFNIKDGKGSIADYVRFFEDSKFTREDADEYGLLGKESNGLAAWSIYADATPATRNATDIAGTGEDGKITVEQAATIAQAAPKDGDKKNVAIQAALVRAAKKGMRGAKFEGYCREMARQLREGKIGENLLVGEQMDLFADETFLAMEKLAEERAKYRAKRSNEYVEIARALRNAVNNGTKLNITDAFAQDLGITDKKDKEQLKKALEKAQERADYWNPQGDRILDQADVEKMDAEINEKADNLAKKLAGIKAKREGKKVTEVKSKETKAEDSFTSLKKGGLGGAGSSKSFDAGDGKHVDVTRWPNGTYSVDIVKNYQALRERVWLPADATNEQIQKAVDEAMTFNPTEPKKKAAKKVAKENESPKEVVSKTETTTPMTLENAKKTLGVGFFAPIKDLKAELAKTPEQATKKRDALKLAIAEAEKRAKDDDDKKPPTPPKGKVKGLELDEATDKAATEALNDVDFMSAEFEQPQDYSKLRSFDVRVGDKDYYGKIAVYTRKQAAAYAKKFIDENAEVYEAGTLRKLRERDIMLRHDNLRRYVEERDPFGLGNRSSIFADALGRGAADAKGIEELRAILVESNGGAKGGSLPKLYSLVPKHSWELGNGARRYYARGDVAIQIYSASTTYRVESVKTALRKILALSIATGNFKIKAFAEGPSGSIFAIGKGKAFKKVPRPDEATVDRILHYEYGLERRPSKSAEEGEVYASPGYGTPIASAKSLSFGEDSSGEIFLVDGDFDMMRDEKVGFMSAEFDYEKFGKLVTGVGKLVDALNKGGYNDFASLARFIASKDAEKYEKAKAVLQDVWNALAKQKGLKRVTDEQADEVFGIIDSEIGGDDNERRVDSDKGTRGDGNNRNRSDARVSADSHGSSGGLLAGGRVRNENPDEGMDGIGLRDVPGRTQGLADQTVQEKGLQGGGEVAGGNEPVGDRNRHGDGESTIRRNHRGNAAVRNAANKAANKNVPPEHPDFVMTPAVEEAILERSPIKRVMNNVAAIRLLQKLKERDFKATPEEQATLAKYVGWGGLSEIFTREYEIAWSFEKDGEVERAKNHAKGAKYGLEGYEAFKELRQTLNDEEYADARATTLTAFYTPIPMVRAEHAALRKLGVLGGRFLGPSAGVGNYASAAGEYVKAVNWQFVEKDQVSGQILKALFPNQRVHIGGYEETKLADSFFDFAIDNVPYADVDITDKSLDKGSYKIHDYFFAKTLSKVRPGGVIMFLTSTGTLDKTDGKLRQFLSRNGGKIVGAVRLPNGFFSKNAGTDVASDLVIIQRVSGEADNSGFMQQEKYGETTSYVRRQGQVSVPLTYNKYFADHPEQIVGEMKAGTGQYGRPMLEYKMPSGNLFEQVEAAIDRALAGVDKDAMMKNVPAAVQKDHTPIYDDEGLRQGNITVKDGKVYEKSGDQLVEAEMPTLKNAQKKALAVRGLVPRIVVEKVLGVRKALRAVVDAQVNGVSDEELQPLIDELNKVYDAFVKKVGTFHDKNVAPFVMLDKADGNRLMTMEKVTKGEDGKNKIEKADILKKRVIFTYQKPTKADTLDDALTISFSETGALDLARIGELLGVSEEEAETKLKEEGKAFENPQTGRVEPYWEYLSGHVRRKLDAARAATANDPQFRKNVEELEKVQPKDVSLDEVTIKFGATWVDPEAMIDFLKEVYDIRGYQQVKLTKNDTVNKWNLELPRSNIEPFGAISFTQEHFLEAVLNSGSLEVKAKDPVTEKYYVLERETEAQKLAAEKLHEAFARFLRTNEKWFEPSSKSFNYAMNDNVAMKLPKDILPLRAAGMNEDTIKKLDAPGREYQPAVIARGVLGGKSLCLAHCVGAGKTLEMQSIGMIGRHLGMFKKSMYVVPNHMLDQFCNEFISAFPNANILKMSTEDVNPKNRRAFFAKVANGDWDAIVVKHSTFSKKLPMTEAWQKEYLQKEVDRLVEAKLAAKGDNGTVKDIEKMIQKAEDKIKKLDGSIHKDNQIVPFEELGVDQLFVDEAHNFKGLPVVSSQARKVKGLDQTDSQRALDMEMKTIYVQSLHGGRKGVVFATGTPLSNAPVVEAFVQLRYLAPWALEEQGIRTFDDFVNSFGKIETTSEFNSDGKTVRENQRITAFVNIPEMMRLFKSVVDIVNSDQIKVKRPKQVLEAVPVPMSEAQAAIMEMVARESAIPPSKEEPQKFLQIAGIAKKACISPRLLGIADDGYKMSACANKVKEVYDQTSDKRGAQLIFTDIFNSSDAKGVEKYVGGLGLEQDEKTFNLNTTLKDMLVRLGIPAEQIGIIHDIEKAKGGDEGKDAAKEEMFAKVRSGEIRVLIGSRMRMGEGTNVQERLAAIHLLHPGWKPSEDTQAIGRIIRPGNIYDTGKVYYYLTQGNKNVGSYETRNHELIGIKDRLIQAIMHGDENVRTMDLDESAAERDMLMGLASANKDLIELIDVKRVLHKAELNVESVGFSARSNADNAERTRSQLEKLQNEYEDQERGAKEWRKQNPDGSFILTTADGRTLEKPKDLAEYIGGEIAKLLAKDRYDREELTEIGNFGGVPLNVNYRFYDNKIHLSIPSIGYAKEIVYSGFVPDFSPQSAVAMKSKVLGLVSPDIEKYHQQILADTKSRIAKLESDAKRFKEEYEAEKKKLAKLRYEKERLERAVTPLVVKTLESHKWSTYGNWIIGKRDDGYIAQRQTDRKQLKARTVKELLPKIDNEDFLSPLQSTKQTMNLPSASNNGSEEASKDVAVEDVDFMSDNLEAPLTDSEKEYAAAEDKTPTEEVSRKVFGMTNEEIATEMRAVGIEPARRERKSDAKTFHQAQILLSDRSYMVKLARAVNRANRPTKDYENNALNLFFLEQKDAVNRIQEDINDLSSAPEWETDDDSVKAMKDLKNRLKEAKALMSEVGQAAISGASEQASGLRSNRFLINEADYSYAGIRGEILKSSKLAELPPELDEAAKNLAQEFKKLDEEGKALATARLKAFSEKVIEDIKNGGKERKRREMRIGDEGRRVLRNYNDALAQVEVHAKSLGGTLVGLGDQMYPTWGKFLKAIGEYHCYVNPEITEEECIAAITEDVNKFMDGVTENEVRDALTGFGHNYRQSRYDSQRLMNDLRSQARMKRQLDYMNEHDQLPPQTGMIRDEPSDEARRLAKKVQDRKKEMPEGGENRLKSLLESAKTRVKNRIADLENAIATKTAIPKIERTTRDDAELSSLRFQKDQLQKQYDALFPGEKRTMTNEERIAASERALQRVVEGLFNDLANAHAGDYRSVFERKRNASPESAKIRLLRNKIDEARRELVEIKKARYEYGMTPDEVAKYLANRMVSVERALDRTAKRLENGDVATVKKSMPKFADPADQKRYEDLVKNNRKAIAKLARLRERAQEATRLDVVAKAKNVAATAFAMQRLFLATLDLSAFGKQGARFYKAHPKLAGKAFVTALKATSNDIKMEEIYDEMMSDPQVKEAVEKYGLHLRSVASSDDVDLFRDLREISVFGKKVTDIPFYGEGMLKSERHYVTYLNEISAAMYTSIINDKNRFPHGATPWQKKMICDMVNMYNGSGAMSKEHRSAMNKNMSMLLWAPGLLISRLQFASGYDILHPFVAKNDVTNAEGHYDKPTLEERMTIARIALRDRVRSSTATLALGALVIMINALANSDDEWEKWKRMHLLMKLHMLMAPVVFNTTVDWSGGEALYTELLNYAITGERMSGTGKLQKLGEYGAPSFSDIALRKVVGYKVSPAFGMAMRIFDRAEIGGGKYGIKEAMRDALVPLIIQDAIDQIAENGKGAALTIPLSVLGIAGSTYDRKPYENAVNSISDEDREELKTDIRSIARSERVAKEQEKRGQDTSDRRKEIEAARAALLGEIREKR